MQQRASTTSTNKRSREAHSSGPAAAETAWTHTGMRIRSTTAPRKEKERARKLMLQSRNLHRLRRKPWFEMSTTGSSSWCPSVTTTALPGTRPRPPTTMPSRAQTTATMAKATTSSGTTGASSTRRRRTCRTSQAETTARVAVRADSRRVS